jgi:hypothetical protein
MNERRGFGGLVDAMGRPLLRRFCMERGRPDAMVPDKGSIMKEWRWGDGDGRYGGY